MQIVNKKIDELMPYEKNPRKNKKAVPYVKKSIEDFGFRIPIVIDSNNTIVCGHTRYLAAKELKMEELPCVVADDLSEEQIRAFRIADNKTAEFSDWDMELLNDELENIINIDMSDFELTFSKAERVKEDDYVPKEIDEIKTQTGDIYQLGNHRLMCGDSTSEADVDKLIGNADIRCVFTSPPYNEGNGLYSEYEDNLGSDEYIEFNKKVVANALRHLRGLVFWNISYSKNSGGDFLKIAYEISKMAKFRDMIVWNKGHGIPLHNTDVYMTREHEEIFLYESEENDDVEIINVYEKDTRGKIYNKRGGKVIHNVWKIDTCGCQMEGHKACYPVKLPAKGIELATVEGENVFEPFGGSGTDIIACEQLNRNCYCMEFSPKYCDLIIDRWEKFTGNKAVKI